MPTHFSKLEGSPLNLQRERQRERERRTRRKKPAATISTATAIAKRTELAPPALAFEESVSVISNVTANEGIVNNTMNINAGSSLRKISSCNDIPHFIHVQNFRRPQQTEQQRLTEQRRQTGSASASGSIPHNREKRISGQYNNYCENRVSAISSFSNQDRPGYSNRNNNSNSNISPPTHISRSPMPSNPRSRGDRFTANVSIENEARDDDRYAYAHTSPPRGRGGRPPPPTYSPRHQRDPPRSDSIDRINRTTRSRSPHGNERTPKSQSHVAYDNSCASVSASAPSNPSTLTTGSSRRKPRAVHMRVNAHGVFGSSTSSISSSHNHKHNHNHGSRGDSHATGSLSSSKRHRAKATLESVGHLDQLVTSSYGDPYIPTSRRRNDIIIIDDDDLGDHDDSLRGERFADTCSVSRDPKQQQQQQSTSGTKWVCDVCKEARFDNYVEAYRHEIECRKHKNKTRGSDIKKTKESHQRGETEANSESKSNNKIIFSHNIDNSKNINHNNSEGQLRRIDHITSHLQEMSLSSSTGSQSSNSIVGPSQAANERNRDHDDGSGDGSGSGNETTRWLCNVCKEISFDRYPDACRHERICRIQREATADLRVTPDKRRSRIETNPPPPSRSYPTQARDDTNCRISDLRGGYADTQTGSADAPPFREQTRDNTFGVPEMEACQNEKIYRIQMEATADRRGAPAKQTGTIDIDIDIDPPPSLYRHTTTAHAPDNGNLSNRVEVATNRPERGQRDDVRDNVQPKDQYNTTMDAIERERLRTTSDPSSARVSNERKPAKDAWDDRCHGLDDATAVNGYGYDGNHLPRDFGFPSVRRRNHKGEAYDRYVLLASQQEEEEERERYIALAKQTRKEELMNYKQGESNSERYVCLA